MDNIEEEIKNKESATYSGRKSSIEIIEERDLISSDILVLLKGKSINEAIYILEVVKRMIYSDIKIL